MARGFTPDEQAAIERAVAEGRVRRVPRPDAPPLPGEFKGAISTKAKPKAAKGKRASKAKSEGEAVAASS